LLSEKVLHFRVEEAIMELFGYPDHALHKEEHYILSKEVANIFKGCIKGERKKSEKIGAF
jgi:hemerythrin